MSDAHEAQASGLDRLSVDELPPDAPEAVRQAKAAGKKILRLSDEFDRGEVLWFRRPTVAEMEQFINVAGFKKRPVVATKRLVKACAIHPSAQEMMARLEAEPMLGTSLADKLQEALGGNREFDLEVF